jgi:hypothetical protein
LSVGKLAGAVHGPEAFISVSVLYSDTVVCPKSIDMVATWDSAGELDGGMSCASVGEIIVDEGDDGGPSLEGCALVLPEAVLCEDCSREASSEDLIVDNDDGNTLLPATGTLGLPGDAVCEDCICTPSLGGINVDADGEGGGALSLGRGPLGEPLGGGDDSLDTGQTVV